MFRGIGGRGAVAAIGALAFAVTGCGGDDEKAASGGEGTSAKPATLAITATGSAKAPVYEAPAKVTAGVVEITFTNNAKGKTDGQLVSVDGEHSDADVVAELGKAISGKPIADWFHGAGGVGGTKAGASGKVTQVLAPGTYYVLGGEEPPKGAPTKFEVTGEAGGELPKTDGRVDASEYAFGGTGLKAGNTKVTFDNTGQQWHHFLAAPLKPNATAADAKKFLTTEGRPSGPPPFTERNGVESAVMDGGVSQVAEVDLKAGRYVFFCFIADRQGGPPHVVKGMVSEVTVE